MDNAFITIKTGDRRDALLGFSLTVFGWCALHSDAAFLGLASLTEHDLRMNC